MNLVKLVNLLNPVNLLKFVNHAKIANVCKVPKSELKKILGGLSRLLSRWWQLSKPGGNTSELILIPMLAPTLIWVWKHLIHQSIENIGADAYLHVNSTNKGSIVSSIFEGWLAQTEGGIAMSLPS